MPRGPGRGAGAIEHFEHLKMARGGARLGSGPPKGAKYRQTLEAELAKAQAQLEALTRKRQEGKKLAIDVLDDCMHLAMGLAAKHQPRSAAELKPDAVLEVGREPNDDKFLQYFGLTIETAGKLANFQSPKFKPTTLMVEQPPGGAAQQLNAPVRAVSAQEAYRMLREGDVIEFKALPAPAADSKPVAPKKKAAR